MSQSPSNSALNETVNISDVPTPPSSSPDSVADRRVDAIIQRFSWFTNPDHQWTATSGEITYPSMSGAANDATPLMPETRTPHHPTTYHLRRRPQIRCEGCLNGEMNQQAHMQRPYGCLYLERLCN